MENNQIIWSHSKLSTLLKSPMNYNLSYNYGVFPKFEKEALGLGSAVHWGIEYNTSDLEKYYEENSKFKNKAKIKDEQITAESMIAGYLTHKNKFFDIILEKDELISEVHELKIYGILPSKILKEGNKFVGIIDLLLLTNRGFIVVDYKTSSSIPNWSNYLDQLYRYIFLLNSEFPETPVYKIAIINLRKCRVKRKPNENDNSFRKRLDIIYQLNDEQHIDVHVFKSNELNVTDMNVYINNLSIMCDAGLSIINNNCYYTNYASLDDYGGSDLKELLLKEDGAYTLYNIRDKYYNELSNTIDDYRDMQELDVDVIFNNYNYIDRYSKFKEIYDKFLKEFEINENFEKFDDYFICYISEMNYNYDEKLIRNYLIVYKYCLKEKEKEKIK